MLKRIQEDIKKAMKEKNTEVRNILRIIVAKAKDIAKNDRNREVTNEDVMTAIQRQIKQNKETISFAKKEARDTTKEEAEITVLMEYLPKQKTEEEIRELIVQIIETISEEGPRARGKVMKELSKYKNEIDMKIASQIAGEFL